ncbi:CLUMA_CG000539, isoform A [Clunio marinus]|uniref:CLUMA_CG000539, isoform A n=1 Tax=Clunio marinus TaxID=568069 RepID=A0A1J1HGM9_9DIPT|nr:CLUMA_CG000539, isoform A [Clunio marinus]
MMTFNHKKALKPNRNLLKLTRKKINF